MILLHSLTVSSVNAELREQADFPVAKLMAGPPPADPLAWDIVVDTGPSFRWGRYDWRHRSLVMSGAELPAARHSPYWQEILSSGQSAGFLRWVRFLWLEAEPSANGQRIYLMDARYTRSRSAGFGASIVELKEDRQLVQSDRD